MNWYEFLQGKAWSWDEIHAKYEVKEQIFTAIGKKVQKDMTKKHIEMSKAHPRAYDLPDDLIDKISKDWNEWSKEWGENSIGAEKLRQDYDHEMNTKLEQIHNANQMEALFRANKSSFEEEPNYEYPDSDFERSIQLQMLEVGGQRKVITGEEFLAELKKTATRNRNRGLERGC